MPIEDVFTITGRGTVVTGRIEQGQCNTGDEVEMVGIHPEIEKTVVTGLEMFNKTLDFAQAGDNAGVLLRGTKREEVERGQVLAKPGRSRLTRTSRPRSTSSRRTRWTPHAVLQRLPAAVLLPDDGRMDPSIQLPEGQEMVMPGDNTNMEVELIQPIAMDQGLRFAVREGGRTVGAGVVTGSS